jgi:Carboxypeptidase regulatory-like domain/TonB dependent receptor
MNKRIFAALAFGVGLAILLFVPVTSRAQAVYGSLVGTITDNTGAAVPNATVVVTDVTKGTSATVVSNGSGEYSVEHLIPDVYNIKVSTTGFKSFEAKGIVVAADTTPKVDAQLQVGGAAETVEVNADAVPVLKTDRADVSTVFNTATIENLPIGDRNFTNLQLLLPGAQQLGWSHAADENPQGSKQIQVDGQAFGGVAFELDGTNNTDPILGIIVINPGLDSVSESKITTQNFDAEFGMAVASVVTAQTKSGTNKFHGSVFDYRESSANLARDPFTQSPNSASQITSSIFPPGLKNQFGGSVGGPILKDKLFFFGDYQGLRQKVGTSSTATVPTTLLSSTCLGTAIGSSGIPGCDFSEYTNVSGAGTGILYRNYPATDPRSVNNGTAYPGNVIPANELSPQALALMTLVAPFAPNAAGGFNNGLVNNYVAGGTGIFNSNQWDVRGDYQVSEKIHAFGRFSRFWDTLSGKVMFGTAGGPGFGIGGYGGNSNGANDSLASGVDMAVSPTLLTDLRLGYYRYNVIDSKYDQGTQFANQLGIPGENTGTNFTSGAPGFQVDMPQVNGAGNGLYGGGLSINRCNCPLTEREDQFQIVNNWTKIFGNHSFKVGADLRYARNLRVPSDTDRTGLMEFKGGPTSNPNLTTAGGLGMATFVQGKVNTYGRYVSTSTNAKEFQKRTFFYAQDTWRVTPNLTVNYGLRYELYFPEAVNAAGNGSLMDLKTGYLHVAGIGGVPSDMGWSPNKNGFNPRLGVAYQLDPKTVIRAGYGRSFDVGVFGSIFGHVVTQNLPVLASQQITTTGGATAFAFSLANGPVAPTPVTVPANGLLPAPGYAVTPKSRPNPLRFPTIDAWNFAVQRSITPTLSMTFAYVGNKGTHTLSAGDGNNTNPNEAALVLPAQYSITGQPLHWDNTVKSGIAANGGTSNATFLQRYYGGTLPACQDPSYAAAAAAAGATIPTTGACGWTNGIANYGDDQNTHYNALQVTMAKQVTRGLSFTGNYAWQSSFNYNSGFYTWDKHAGYGRDDSTRQQQLVAYGTYDLPFGRNKQFLSTANGIVNQIVAGWEFSPVVNWSSGLPFTLGFNECNASVGGTSAPCYPNGSSKSLKTSLGGLNPVGHTRTYYKSVVPSGQNLCDGTFSGFSCPALDQLGSVGRNNIFGPHFFNADLSAQKNFPIREAIFAQFRVDAFNGFNHINPANPGGNIESDGTISGQAPGAVARQLQFSLRVQF